MRFFSDVVRLLMNPLLSRRAPGTPGAPLGGYVGAALTAAFVPRARIADAPREIVPLSYKLRWLHPVDLESTFCRGKHSAAESTIVRFHDDNGALGGPG